MCGWPPIPSEATAHSKVMHASSFFTLRKEEFMRQRNFGQRIRVVLIREPHKGRRPSFLQMNFGENAVADLYAVLFYKTTRCLLVLAGTAQSENARSFACPFPRR